MHWLLSSSSAYLSVFLEPVQTWTVGVCHRESFAICLAHFDRQLAGVVEPIAKVFLPGLSLKCSLVLSYKSSWSFTKSSSSESVR